MEIVCSGYFFCEFDPSRVIWEEGLLIEKMPSPIRLTEPIEVEEPSLHG